MRLPGLRNIFFWAGALGCGYNGYEWLWSKPIHSPLAWPALFLAGVLLEWTLRIELKQENKRTEAMKVCIPTLTDKQLRDILITADYHGAEVKALALDELLRRQKEILEMKDA